MIRSVQSSANPLFGWYARKREKGKRMELRVGRLLGSIK